MKERPILMKGPLVLASLEDRKTQTRRIVKPQFGKLWGQGVRHGDDAYSAHVDIPVADGWAWVRCPYGAVGDLLWVRETFSIVPTTAYRASTGVQQTINPCDPDDAVIYRAGWDRSDPGTRWRPSIHMPRWASRLTLEITGVRVERVQEISEADICAELGCPLTWEGDGPEPYRRDLYGAFANLWDTTTTNPAHRWESNPWVWCISYKRIAQPE